MTVFVTIRAGATTGSSCTGWGVAGATVVVATVVVTRDPASGGGTGSTIWDRDAGADTTGSGTMGTTAMVSCDVQAGFAVAMANMSPTVVAALSAATAFRDPAARCALRVFAKPPVRSVIVFVVLFVFFLVLVLVLVLFLFFLIVFFVLIVLFFVFVLVVLIVIILVRTGG